jgi:hypothetical protein
VGSGGCDSLYSPISRIGKFLFVAFALAWVSPDEDLCSTVQSTGQRTSIERKAEYLGA